MKSIHKEELYIKKDKLSDQLFEDNCIFFDIETTGFSPAHSSLYLIGCARKKNNTICIDQFFAEKPEEEKVILSAFLEILKQYDTIISFNGIGFDIPFLKAKCDRYGLEENFKSFGYIDIFKSITPIKCILKLENYKQKTIEKFLDLKRDDLYSGKELINVYESYVKAPDEESFALLQLHNYEDVIGMIDLLPVMSYLELFNSHYSIKELQTNEYLNYHNETCRELLITLKNDYPVPQKVSHKFHDFYLSISPESTMIRVPIVEDELHYFFSDYKNYYYLPEEDIAVHKSVAAYVDKAYRENAKAYNCYSKKRSIFLPQLEPIMNPAFKYEYKDKISYFELTDDFMNSDVMLRRYVDHLLFAIISKK